MDPGRRILLQGLAAASALALAPVVVPAAPVHRRPVPSTGQSLPVVGLGSWITFDVPPTDKVRRRQCIDVMRAFFAAGGAMIDSSPMYGYAQDVISAGLRALNFPPALFAATKVWIPGASIGQGQMEQARALWGVERFDLIHVHNLLDWETHLRWLSRWREEGRVRTIGVSTSHGRRHAELERVIRSQPVDFVQFTYNIADRQAEQRLLPLAAENGRAVVINRPFRGGALFRHVAGRALPALAAELDCRSWAQFFLKFIVSHPAVCCAIPATTRVDHLEENMAVLSGSLPDPAERSAMAQAFDALR
jgi:diketogulonate reductase-like aldo/keto reductase